MEPGPDAGSGLLPVDKPAGPTSHDVVAAARRALSIRRIGHTGTLDPFASGLLILCVGPATRLAEYLSGLPKTYVAVLKLGERTDTDDCTGAVIAASDRWREVSREEMVAALAGRAGRQLQVPPGYSAKKVAGERLYQKARRGETFTPEAVEVDVSSIQLTGWNPPFARFVTTCSSGTYVRAIARDAGLDLGCGAPLAELRRTAVGPHHVSDAVSLEALRAGSFRGPLRSPLDMLSHLPRLEVDEVAAEEIRHGRAVAAPPALIAPVVLVVRGDVLLAVGGAAGGRLRPAKVFDA